MDIDAAALIADVGAALGAAEIYQLEDDAWLVVFDDDFAVSVERDIDGDSLMLGTDLGLPAAGQELVAYKMLLAANAAWRETGGLRLGLDPLDDAVLLFQHVRLAELEREAAREALEGFVGAARNGREFIAALGDEQAGGAEIALGLMRA
jgi:hypothetical protein